MANFRVGPIKLDDESPFVKQEWNQQVLDQLRAMYTGTGFSAGSISWTTAGNVTIGAPTGGNTLTVQQVGSNVGLVVNSTGANVATIQLTANNFPRSWRFVVSSSIGYFRLRDETAGSDRLEVSTSGNVTINAPSSGIALQVNGINNTATADFVTTGTTLIDVRATTSNAAAVRIAGNGLSVGTTSFDLQQDSSGNVDIVQRNNLRMSLYTNNTERVTVAAAGNVTIAAPSSGATLTLGTYSQQTPITVASLPAAATGNKGARYFVSDANATTYASVVAGGGGNIIPVYSDGTNWRIG